MKNLGNLILIAGTSVTSWLRGTERIAVQARQARGRLGLKAMAEKIQVLGSCWTPLVWLLSSAFFLLLMGLSYVPGIGGYLWLGFAPVVSASMLRLAVNGRPGGAGGWLGWLRWAVRCVVLNYTVLAWFFFFLVCGAATAVLLAGLLDWCLIRLPFKRAWSFSLLHLAWILPLVFFLGVIGKAIRFYLGAYLALPLVVFRDGGVMRSIGASRSACRGQLGVVAFWMMTGWAASFFPALFFLGGTGILLFSGAENLPGTFSSLWKIYAGSTVLLAVSGFLALLAWPFGFLAQAAAFRQVFGERAECPGSSGSAGR